jgi:hypothetical protein
MVGLQRRKSPLPKYICSALMLSMLFPCYSTQVWFRFFSNVSMIKIIQYQCFLFELCLPDFNSSFNLFTGGGIIFYYS